MELLAKHDGGNFTLYFLAFDDGKGLTETEKAQGRFAREGDLAWEYAESVSLIMRLWFQILQGFLSLHTITAPNQILTLKATHPVTPIQDGALDTLLSASTT